VEKSSAGMNSWYADMIKAYSLRTIRGVLGGESMEVSDSLALRGTLYAQTGPTLLSRKNEGVESMAGFPFSNEKLKEIIDQTERMMNKYLDQGSFKEVSEMRLKLIELREERDRRKVATH
jgi:hypothetical protein